MALIPLNTFKTKTAILTTATYNAATCARDTELIVDSIAFDLLHAGTSQSTFAGLSYWAQGAIKIPGEVFQTLAALDRAKAVALQLVMNTAVVVSPGNIVAQVTDLVNPGDAAGQARISEEFDLISKIIENGTAGTTGMIKSNGAVVSTTGLINSANLLYANKAFLRAEIIAYLDSQFNTFTYNKALCLRDTKLIVDSLAFDLLTNSTSQSAFSGVQYWSQGSSSIPAEADQTIAALTRANSIVQQIVVNDEVIKTAGNNLTQFINISAAGDATSATLIGTLFNRITGIITAGTVNVGDSITPNGEKTSYDTLLNSYELIQTNKVFIQTEIVAWITDAIANASSGSIWLSFVYNSDKCYRDVGYIIDCICFDLLYGGNRQSTQAGVYYYGHSAVTSVIPTEQSMAVTAYNHLRTILSNIVRAEPIAAPFQTTINQTYNLPPGSATEISYMQGNVDIITGIIENGPGSVIPTPITLSVSTDPQVINAWRLMLANKDFIAAEIIGFIDNQTSGAFDYDQAKCSRDVGTILDSLGYDLMFGSNFQSVKAGDAYYRVYSANVLTSSEKKATLSALNFVKSNMLVTLSITNDATAIASATANINTIIDIITNGISVEPAFVMPDPAGYDTGYQHARDLIASNAAFIKAEIAKYILVNYPLLTYDTSKCQRDIGFIVDALRYDLTYGGNVQSLVAGDSYYNNAILYLGVGEKVPALAAYNYMKSLVLSIGQNILVTPLQTVVTQVTGTAGTLVAAQTAQALVENIRVIIDAATTPPALVLPSTAWVAPGLLSSFNDLQTAKSTIQANTITDINSKKYFDYNRDLCSRDVGYIVDCITFDIMHTGNRQAIQAAVDYFNHSATISIVPTEKSDTIDAYNYMKGVISSVILATKFKNPKQTAVLQRTSMPAATSTEVTLASANVTLINNIITSGPGITSSPVPISLTASTDANIIKAFNLMIANKAFIVAEVIGYINSFITPNTTKIYTAPPGVTAIILMAQVANVTENEIKVTFAHYRNLAVFADPATLNGSQSGDTLTELVKEFTIPPNDSASLVNGKMIVESFDSIVAFASTTGGLKVTLSILETANA